MNCDICKKILINTDLVLMKNTDYVYACAKCRDTKKFKSLERLKASQTTWLWKNIFHRGMLIRGFSHYMNLEYNHYKFKLK